MQQGVEINKGDEKMETRPVYLTKIKRIPQALFSDANGIYKAEKCYCPVSITKVQRCCFADAIVIYNDSVSLTKFY